jgi:hypothetical protein
MTRFLIAFFALLFALPSSATDPSEEEDPIYGRLVIIANFDSTEVQINGVSYPYEWVYGDMEGVLLPAEMALEVVVSTSPEQRRTFRMRLDEGETRVLVVDIENMGASPAAPIGNNRPRPRVDDDDELDDDEEETGFLGVSSSPRGIVHVDGTDTGERTPARRIPLEPGRHEVQIWYDDEEIMSETKHVLIRAGVNTNVFFRLRREQLEEARGGNGDEENEE